MGYYEEELKSRKRNDDEALKQSILGVAGAVVGKAVADSMDKKEIASSAIEKILNYFHCSSATTDENELPKSSFEEELDYKLQPHGIMHREVKLDKGWQKCAVGPMLATYKDNGKAVALIPSNFFGYYYYDIETQTKKHITSKNANLFNEQATCFYRPFPYKEIRIRDLLKFMISQFSIMDIVVSLLLVVVTVLLGFLSPLFSKWLFSFVLESQDVSALISTAVFMGGFIICDILVICYQSLIRYRIAIKIHIAVEAATMHRVISLSPNFFREYSAGELANRTGYVSALCDTLLDVFGSTTLTSLLSLCYIGQIFTFASSLVAPALLITLLTVAFSIVVIIISMKISRKRMLIDSKESGMSYAMITGIQKIKLAGAEKRMFARWANLYSKSVKITYNPPLILKISSVISLAISLIGNLLLYYISIKTKVNVSDYYAFNTAYGMVSSAFAAFTSVAAAIGSMKPSYEMAAPILKTIPEVSNGKQTVLTLEGAIEFNNVTFHYSDDSPNVIENLSFKINAGDYVAIVGETGCGKSTLVRLMLGFEKPQKGAIYYDKKDLSSLELKSLRNKIGTVMQDTKLFQGDIYSNIVVAAPWIDQKGAWEAAKIASIDEDIRNFPMGMNTLISEGNGGISGGQRQRLAIARAVVNKPKILIFDEATSALDNLTQKKVSEAIDKYKCTRVIIAHRLSTIKNCERILVLKEGHIVEDGNYDTLIKAKGTFAELIKRQRLDVSNKELDK